MGLFDLNIPSLPWVKSEALFTLNDQVVTIHSGKRINYLTWSDLFRGVQVFGSIGSGKTSGSGKEIAKGMLASGAGGLVLCVKDDEADTWKSYLKDSNRLDDLIEVTVDGDFTFNFIDSALKSGHKTDFTANITKLILDVYKLYSRNDSQSNQDSFWGSQLQTALIHAICIARTRSGEISLRSIFKVIIDAVKYSDGLKESNRSNINQNHFLTELRHIASINQEVSATQDAVDYFLSDFCALAEKTRSIIVVMLRTVAEPLMMEPLERLFSKQTTISIDQVNQGKVIVINIPVHKFNKIGLMAQLIWKYLFMDYVKGRSDTDRPLFLWADESQYFADESDIHFLTTARSLKCATVYLTQNISNYEATIGSTSKVNAILGSLNVKIFHQNNDPKTIQFARDAVGKTLQKKVTTTIAKAGFFSSKPDQKSTSISKFEEYDLPSKIFSELREGGTRNKNVVEAIVHCPGKKFDNGKSWFVGWFRQ